MESKLRLLGIAPYEDMQSLMLEVAREYEEIDLTVFVGDLQQGVEMAQRNFYNDYDAIISRGGTASMLRERLDLPVIEIPILPQDIIRAVALAESISKQCAIVGFTNITASAEMLCRMMGFDIEICPVQDAGAVEHTLLSVREKGVQVILCDKIAHTTALRLGLDVVLITSGPEGIHSAFSEALRLYHNFQRLREENRFFRSLIWNQVNHTVVLDDQGDPFFSTLSNSTEPILDVLREESKYGEARTKRRIIRQIKGVQYSISMNHETFCGKMYTIFHFSSNKVPSADVQRGIRYFGWPEAEAEYQGSLYGLIGFARDLQDKITQVDQANQPLMVCGESGTCKEQIVNYMYFQSALRDKPLAIVDCFLLNSKAWTYLMDHHNSPLTQSGLTIFVKNVDALSTEQRAQMLAAMLATNICKRNRMIFSCICPKDELISKAGIEVVEKLACLSLYLPPLRHRANKIPALANMYLSHLNTSTTRQIMGLEAMAMQQLQEFDWPHNYTQFQRTLKELALAAATPYITVQQTEAVLRRERTMTAVSARAEIAREPLDLSQPLDRIEKEIIQRVLAEENGNQSRTARRLGISRTTLWRIMNSIN